MNLLTTSDVADRLGVSISTVLCMVDAGTLTPALKAPGKRGAYMFDRTAIDNREDAA